LVAWQREVGERLARPLIAHHSSYGDMYDAILASCSGAVVRASVPAAVGSEERPIPERVER
jgi:hypothetical protein